MDKSPFLVAVTRTLTEMPSRRDILRGLASTGLGLGMARRSDDIAQAKKKRKKRKKTKKPRPNAFGCLEVGDACKTAEQCCSGICDAKKCRAHGTGTCKQGIKGACEVPLSEAASLKCNNEAGCFCFQTTAGSNFCAAPIEAEHCSVCATDDDCLALGLPPGSACALISQGHCAGTCESGMACLVPCGVLFPTVT